MSEENGSMSGGGFLSPVDWSYPIAGFSAKDFIHQDSYYNEDDDDEDLDSYYSDLPPIDMTERLKEVNKALAEDSTPIESDRVTKLRFKEVIAEFQSPRESDSDDGYGDSSEIMFDAEDENDIIYHSSPPRQNGASTSSHSLGLHEEPKGILDIRGSEELTPSALSMATERRADTAVLTPFSSFANNKIKLVVKPVLKEQPQSLSIEEVLEEELAEELSIEEVPRHPFSVSSDATEGSQGSEEGLRLSDGDDQRHGSHSYEGDDDVFEDESEIDEEIGEEEVAKDDFSVVTEQIATELEKRDCLNDSSVDTENNAHIGSKVRHKSEGGSNAIMGGRSSSDSSVSSSISSKVVKNTQQNIIKSESNKNSNSIDSKTHLNTKESKVGKMKLNLGNKPSSQNDVTAKSLKLKPNKGEKPSSLSSSQPIPSIKQSLSPYEISTSMLREPRGRKNLSRSLNPSELKQNRSRLNASNVSPTKSPLEGPVQYTRSSRDVRARKGSPDPRRNPKLHEKKPVKAIHNQSPAALNQAAKTESKNAKSPKSIGHHVGVRKAASTSDLCKGLTDEPGKLNKDVYEQWLQQKNRQAAITKRQIDEARAMELAEAAGKLQERKKLAEEAFQQWLRRKRDQLKMEKRMKHHQRKLDHQANYARTRTQCEEAYKEWWKRKNEEMSVRRVSGNTSVRSRSLERTWIQEKTRKLYNTYISKH